MSAQAAFAAVPLWKSLLQAVSARTGAVAAPVRPAEPRAARPTAEGGEVFEQDVLIRFSHCDPAGIVFYPQYFVILNGFMEDWFSEGLGVDFADMVTRRRLGIPTARIDCTFLRPSRLGDRLRLGVVVTRVGESSISIEVQGKVGDELRLKAVQTLVVMSLDAMKAIPIPAEIRSALERYRVAEPGALAGA